MNDKELLELAAKAAGYSLYESDTLGLCHKTMVGAIAVDCNQWNPLTDDGDALRLAVKLEMQVEYLEMTGNARARSRSWGNTQEWQTNYCMQDHLRDKDPYAATRRAIVRAAAEIGEEMK